MTKDEALKLALEFLEALGDNHWNDRKQAITAIKEALAQPEHIGFMDSKLNPIQITRIRPTPACPKGLIEYHCDVEGVDVVCFLDFTPEEFGSRDHYGLPNEPDHPETMELVNAYVKGTDVDIGHLLMQSLVDELTTQALKDFKNDDF
jgi:hypothetical protein